MNVSPVGWLRGVRLVVNGRPVTLAGVPQLGGELEDQAAAVDRILAAAWPTRRGVGWRELEVWRALHDL